MIFTLASLFFSSFLIALSGALMPGPLLTVTISESSRRGALAGPLMMLGHGALEFVLVLALLSGLAPILHHDGVFITIAMFGGGTLFFMALSMMKNISTLRLCCDSTEEKPRNLIVAGIMLSLTNPYWLLWWVSIGFGYIMHSANFGVAGVVSFFSGHVLADVMWYTLISYGVARGRNVLGDTMYRGLIGTCATFLLFFACYFIYRGIEKLI